MKSSLRHIIALTALMLGSAVLCAAELPGKGSAAAPSPPRKLADLVYKQVGDKSLKLDLYLPEKSAAPSPLIVWIHGGGWREGSKHGVPILAFVSKGFAVASIDYRLSGEAPFPAQIEDVKAALRWLRTYAQEYRLDPDQVGLIGHSAGGHLASLAGVTGHGSSFDVGENLERSSAVQAVCVMSGPSDMVKMFDDADEHRRSALVALFGGSLPEKRSLAEAASPLTYVRSEAPPFLFIHGNDDAVVPVEQAKMMSRKLEEIGAKPKVIILPQTGHNVFSRTQEYVDEIEKFFTETLRKKR